MYAFTFISLIKPIKALLKWNRVLIKISFLILIYSPFTIFAQPNIAVEDVICSAFTENGDIYLELGPNPLTSDQVTLFKDSEIEILKLDVMSSQGELVFSKKVESNQTYHLENISSGLYYFKVQTDVGIKTLTLQISEN